jgi:GNAT superfamily N-acetyltransferase
MTCVNAVRRAEAADAPILARIHVTSWQHAYADLLPRHVLDELSVDDSEARWRGRLPAREPYCCLVAVDTGNVPLGFVSAGPNLDEPSEAAVGQVYAIYVHPGHWRAGRGSALLTAATAHLRAIGCVAANLWVLETNVRARAFYSRHGWHADGRCRTEPFYGTDLRVAAHRIDLIEE